MDQYSTSTWNDRLAESTREQRSLNDADTWSCPTDVFGFDVNEMLQTAPADAKKVTCVSKELSGSVADDALDRFTQLEYLNLALNNITSIPSSWEWTKDVTELILLRNKIYTIPETWQGSPEDLRLSINKITSIPETWQDSPSNLDLIGNEILAIPETWQDSPFDLSLYSNEIVAIPETWQDSPSKLSLSRNKITRIPPTWLASPNEQLTLSFNKISSIPSTWENSSSDLSLDYNEITSIPLSWQQSPGEELNLGHNPITSLPESWDGLHPQRLYLDGIHVAGTMPALEQLNGNKTWTSPADGLGFGTHASYTNQCYDTHFGEKCDQLVTCSKEHGLCLLDCYGKKGNGECSFCQDNYVLPNCLTTANPTPSPTQSPAAVGIETPVIIGVSLAAVVVLGGGLLGCWLWRKKQQDNKLASEGPSMADAVGNPKYDGML